MKHIIFIFLILALTACNQNRNNEYICNPETKGFTKSTRIIIFKDKVSEATQDQKQYTYDIIEETNEKIIFGYKSMHKVDTAPHTFYKRTKKYKFDVKGTTKTLFGVWACEKIN